MFTMNKTLAWLESLDSSKRDEVIRAAKQRTPGLKARFRRREQEINDLRAKRLEEKREKVRAKAAKVMNDRRALIAKVNAMGGLWDSEEEFQQERRSWRRKNSSVGSTHRLIGDKYSSSPSFTKLTGHIAKAQKLVTSRLSLQS